MTTAPTVFNPNISPTAGELAQSNVPTAYDIEQDRVAGLLGAPQALDPMATSLDDGSAGDYREIRSEKREPFLQRSCLIYKRRLGCR